MINGSDRLIVGHFLTYLPYMETNGQQLILKKKQSIHFITTQHIRRCESRNAYTIIFLIDDYQFTISKNIKKIEATLEPYGFLRTHQSHLVNCKLIKRFERENNQLVLDNDESIPVAQRKRSLVIRHLDKFGIQLDK